MLQKKYYLLLHQEKYSQHKFPRLEQHSQLEL